MRIPLIALGLFIGGCGGSAYPTTGALEKNHSDLDRAIDPAAVIEVVASGFDWTEGPVWIPGGEYLLFSNIPDNEIVRWSEGEEATTWLHPSGYTGDDARFAGGGSNGLLLDATGALVLAQHGDRRMARLTRPLSEPAPEFETLAGTFNGARFNSPNDAAYRSDGTLWFTDPPYGLMGASAMSDREIETNGVYVLEVDGTVRLITDALSRPNGIGFSPDESTLYVANSDPGQAIWMAYPVDASGAVGEGVVFYDATDHVASEKGLPDGLKVDQEGRIYATGPGGVWVFAPDATLLGRIRTGEATSNVAFGGKDGRMLYMTADDHVMRIQTRVPGMGF